MINAMIDAISISLYAEFGDRYTIYANEVKQGLKEPCFFVSCINPANRLYFDKRYFRENAFCIQYFPADKDRVKEECNEIAERLFLCLEWLTVAEDLVMGTKMRSETVDGILNFFVNYDMFVYLKKDDAPAMEELKQETTMKGTVM